MKEKGADGIFFKFRQIDYYYCRTIKTLVGMNEECSFFSYFLAVDLT